MAKKKRRASSKRGFTPADKSEAIRLMVEERYTQKQVAAHFKCSLATIQSWKSQYKQGKVAGPTTAAEQRQASEKAVAPSRIPYEGFVRKYWQENGRAVNVLLMDQAIRTEIFKYVEEALQYAYGTFQK